MYSPSNQAGRKKLDVWIETFAFSRKKRWMVKVRSGYSTYAGVDVVGVMGNVMDLFVFVGKLREQCMVIYYF